MNIETIIEHKLYAEINHNESMFEILQTEARIKRDVMKTDYFPVGTKVKGNYCGVDFIGLVSEDFTHYNESTQQMDYWITLDTPIMVFGTKRTSVITNAYQIELNN